MKSLTKVFNNSSVGVEKVTDNQYMFDISGVAKKYGTKFSQFERNKSYSDYMKRVEIRTHLTESELIIKSGHSIKVHQLVFVEFMRWVDTDFSVEANQIVFGILSGDIVIKDRKIARLEFENKQLKSGKIYRGGEMALKSILKQNKLKVNVSDALDHLVSIGSMKDVPVTTIYRELIDTSIGTQSSKVLSFKESEILKIFGPFSSYAISASIKKKK